MIKKQFYHAIQNSIADLQKQYPHNQALNNMQDNFYYFQNAKTDSDRYVLARSLAHNFDTFKTQTGNKSLEYSVNFISNSVTAPEPVFIPDANKSVYAPKHDEVQQFIAERNTSYDDHQLTNLGQVILAYQDATGIELSTENGKIKAHNPSKYSETATLADQNGFNFENIKSLPNINLMHDLNMHNVTDVQTVNDVIAKINESPSKTASGKQIRYMRFPLRDEINYNKHMKIARQHVDKERNINMPYNYKTQTISDAKKFLTRELPKYDDFQIEDVIDEQGKLKQDAGDVFAGYLDENQVTEEQAKEHLEGNEKLIDKANESFGYKPEDPTKQDYFVKSYLADYAMEKAYEDPNVKKSLSDLADKTFNLDAPDKGQDAANANEAENQQFEQLSLDLDGLDDNSKQL